MIDYNKSWHELNISIDDALNKDWDPEEFRLNSEFADGPLGIWFIEQSRLPMIFNTTWLDYMSGLNLDIGSCIIFYRAPHYIHPHVHVDMYKETGKPLIFGLNWVIDPEDDSEMIWYETAPPGGESQITPAITDYLNWPMEELKDIPYQSHCIGRKLTLVNVAKPHNIIVKNKARWVLSIRFPKLALPINNWNEAVDYFKPFIKE